ncbi:MAG: hypothetical protein U0S48_08915 [Solirubrobacteraceae bacterium]
MAGLDPEPRVAQLAQPCRRAALRLVVVAEGREAPAVEDRGEMGDIDGEDELVADAHRLVAGGEQQLDRAVAK